jgi:hypothetical protein
MPIKNCLGKGDSWPFKEISVKLLKAYGENYAAWERKEIPVV